MASELAKAYVQIIPTAEGIQGNLEKLLGPEAEKAGKSAGSALSSALGTALKVGAAGVAAASAALVGVGKELVSGASKTAEYGDNIDKMSQKMGLSIQAYQEWDAIMQHSGTSIESLQASMKTLANAVERDNDAFARLGITESDLESLNNEELFAATITALQNVENETERTYLAGQVLGRGATELGALLNTSAEDTEAMRQRVHELGGVMSDEAVKSAAAFQDQLQDMKTAAAGLTRGFLSELLPSITSIMGGMTALFSGMDGGYKKSMEQFKEGIGGITKTISDKLPGIMEAASEIVLALGDAIVANLPAFFDAGTQVLMTLVDGTMQNLPYLVETGMQIIGSLITGIAESLPDMIPTIVDVVLQIVDTLTNPDTLSVLIEAAIAIILALASGLLDAMPRLIDKLPVIIDNIVITIADNLPKIIEAGCKITFGVIEGILKAVPTLLSKIPILILTAVDGIVHNLKGVIEAGERIVTAVQEGFAQKVEAAKQWGRDLIQNFIQGIKDKLAALKDAVKSVASTVKSFIGFSEPELGPLSDFHTFAPDMMELFAQGIHDNLGVVRQAARDAAQSTRGEMTMPVQNFEPTAARYGADNGEIVSTLLACTAQIVSALQASGGAADIDQIAARMWAPMQRQNTIHGASMVSFSR